MTKILVLQHTESEFLGLIEDHLEARRIGFQYLRPFTDSAWALKAHGPADGLMLLGGGPWGSAGGRDLPTLGPEIDLTADFLKRGQPVIGFGLGAQILARAAGGDSIATAFEFALRRAGRAREDVLNGFLPESFPFVRYGRDRAVPPPEADILAVDEDGAPALFQLGGNCFGFAGSPGIKSGIVEDLIMEFEEGPEDPIAALEAVRAVQGEMGEALRGIMIGLVQITGWMDRDGG